MKKIAAVLVALLAVSGILSANRYINASAPKAELKHFRFDLGGDGTEDGFIGVSADDLYDQAKGYGFNQKNGAFDSKADGSGALSDAVSFRFENGHFKVDLPKGVYKITVTTGNDNSTTISAEGVKQLYFLTGNNAKDSFTIPITDGQLNIYATYGVGENHSIAALDIEQISQDTATKPVIWVCGDSTAASYYNVSDTSTRGWGEYLHKYVNTDKYDIRNISASGLRSQDLKEHLFPTVEHYAKKGDIVLFSLGINDYTDAYNINKDNPDPTEYKKNMTELIRRAKAKNAKVLLVKQHGNKGDVYEYPVPKNKWFGKELDKLAKSENASIIDTFTPWLEFGLENNYNVYEKYYSQGIHLNAEGSDKIAKIVADRLFPEGQKATPTPTGIPEPKTCSYQAEASGGPVKNPHKGFVMTAYNPRYIDSKEGYEYGIGGSAGNRAWDVVTIVSGEPKWRDFNPEKGKFDFKQIDDMLATCQEYGLTYGIRIIPYSSFNNKDYVPQWVYDNGAKKNTGTNSHDHTTPITFPKWDDKVYLEAHKALVTALAKKYDGDPRVEFVDIRPFGDFGEWHNSFVDGDFFPSLEIQKDMLRHYAASFKKTTLALPTGAYGEIYDYALSLGISKRSDNLISTVNAEWNLRPVYKANLPVLGENYWPYAWMIDKEKNQERNFILWSPDRFRETIEISHLSIFALDQDGNCSYNFYKQQKSIIDRMCNRLGYNYTVKEASLYGNKLVITISNTGVAPSFFNIRLSAEITDTEGNRTGSFGKPVTIAKGSFHDGATRTFVFTYDGTLDSNATICLAMYDMDNPLVSGKDPTIKFDNKNTLPNNRLKLVETWRATPTPTQTPTPSKSPEGPTPTAKVSLTLDKKSATTVCGKTLSLKADLKGASSDITWTSSAPKTASVDSSGKITAKMAGDVTITASAAGKKASCKITVLYKDVTNTKDFWYAPTNYLTAKGVVKGYDKQTLFKPSNKCTRAQMVTFIWRLQGEPSPKSKTCRFKDVKKTDYFCKACIWGSENKIVEGYKDGTFGPQITCARKHAVTFLWRLAGKPTSAASKNKFKDVKKTDYFYKATLWASEQKILAGYSDGTFRPNGDCLRRQMVTFLYKYDRFINLRSAPA